ncbi:MAG: hypothetical protein Q8K34_11585 [Hydrogenophaga sp.]|uniref:hypothetical protein n=1 Tax=Hydrogenophaga sp. TaxID=1904254 RepID=UPI00271E8D69|nr:hypothetical protein [Hydrogenophaga sp.]MDO9479453.1 hypothetical protein [Hydrogenophaga sp.]MDP2220826.1 hypothetical protein [Hydrogenophaga sp.]MDP3344601.1 hypothetical protein [Hydrogenophaga sp.]MDP3806587.1 hypothetical protein [Hydrogenophaga sp.]MDP3924456.1 hypothetical protein [Hydrogenophaga sp.]
MKSRDLFTIHDLIASNYTISRLPSGKYRHQFTPATTATVYEFEANATPVVAEGERYNIGYTVDPAGRNIVDLSALSLTSQVNPMLSFLAAQHIAQGNFSIEKAKNDQRVTHSATDGYYWGKKYAWRMFGTVIAKSAFFEYLEEIGHPSVPCITRDPDLPYSNDESTAYKEIGLETAMRNLVASAVRASPAYFKSPLYSKKFTIKGINALTDKK